MSEKRATLIHPLGWILKIKVVYQDVVLPALAGCLLKHRLPSNGLTDFLGGFASRSTAGSQGGNVNDPVSVSIPLYFVWRIVETSDIIKIFNIIKFFI